MDISVFLPDGVSSCTLDAAEIERVANDVTRGYSARQASQLGLVSCQCVALEDPFWHEQKQRWARTFRVFYLSGSVGSSAFSKSGKVNVVDRVLAKHLHGLLGQKVESHIVGSQVR